MDPLFGSETRARVLAQLATTPRPQSAYRIARTVGAEPIQVLKILKELDGLTQRSPEGWVLASALLRAFLRDRLAHDEARIREEKDELLIECGMRPSRGHERGRVRQDHRLGA